MWPLEPCDFEATVGIVAAAVLALGSIVVLFPVLATQTTKDYADILNAGAQATPNKRLKKVFSHGEEVLRKAARRQARPMRATNWLGAGIIVAGILMIGAQAFAHAACRAAEAQRCNAACLSTTTQPPHSEKP